MITKLLYIFFFTYLDSRVMNISLIPYYYYYTCKIMRKSFHATVVQLNSLSKTPRCRNIIIVIFTLINIYNTLEIPGIYPLSMCKISKQFHHKPSLNIFIWKYFFIISITNLWLEYYLDVCTIIIIMPKIIIIFFL